MSLAAAAPSHGPEFPLQGGNREVLRLCFLCLPRRLHLRLRLHPIMREDKCQPICVSLSKERTTRCQPSVREDESVLPPPAALPAPNHMRGRGSVSHLYKRTRRCQPIIQEDEAVSANQKRGRGGVSQSKERTRRCQPIKREDEAVSANQKRGLRGVSQSTERTRRCQPSIREDASVSTNHRRGQDSASPSKEMIMIISPFGQLGLWAPSSGVQDVLRSRDILVIGRKHP
jgi:hypothetical protein